MSLVDYVIGNSKEMMDFDRSLYNNYYNKHASIVIASCVTGILLQTSYLILPVVAMTGDLFVRAINGEKGNKPVSGLVGLVRDKIENR